MCRRSQSETPRACEALDECLILTPSSVFRQVGFDEYACPNWHLYAVDYCLDLGERSLDVYVLPFPLHHESTDPVWLPGGYYRSLRRVVEKHKSKAEIIPTSVGRWQTRNPDKPLFILPISLHLVAIQLEPPQRRSTASIHGYAPQSRAK